MSNLTLEQVKAANRPAIGIVDDCKGYIFFPGRGLMWFDWWMHVSTTLGIYADVVEADKRAAADRVQAAWEASRAEDEAEGEGGRVVAFRQAGGNPS